MSSHDVAPGAPVPGVDVDAVTDWLVAHAPDATPPLRFEVITGGHSNLTMTVTDAGGSRFVLRRPPLGHVLASAHDMGREHRILDGLQSSAVPVPPLVGLCTDPAVNDAPFYVMRFVEGHVLRSRDEVEAILDETARGTASRSLVETLATIHAVDLHAAGLSDLGRHEAYIARQLKRWYGQWNQGKTRDLPLVDEIHAALSAHIPEQGPATIVHGDYRLDNCLVDDSGNVVAVLDWEICTLGDPLADLGMLLVYWTGPDDEPSAWDGDGTTAPGFWNRDQLAAHYAAVTGRDLSQLDFYLAFAFWKLACILEGVYARYLGGALGERDPAELQTFKAQVEAAAKSAHSALERVR